MRYVGRISVIPVLLLFPVLIALPAFLPTDSFGQLAPATWVETAVVQAGELINGGTGPSPALPEEVSGTLSGQTYSVDADLVYGPPGPPQATATASASYTSGPPSLFSYANTTINFEVQVIQTSEPPISITEVPVTVTAHGAVNVSGDVALSPYANVTMQIYQGEIYLILGEAFAQIGDTETDNFDLTETTNVAPDVPIHGTIFIAAGTFAEIASPGSADASAFGDPTFAVADAVVPGTEVNYRDYFTIEYGEGFWALGNTPTQTTTWGRIKSLY